MTLKSCPFETLELLYPDGRGGQPATWSRRMSKSMDVTQEILKRKVLTIPEVSEYLRVSRQTIYRMLKRGDIPAFRIGGDWRFNVEDLGHWIENESQARESRLSRKQ